MNSRIYFTATRHGQPFDAGTVLTITYKGRTKVTPLAGLPVAKGSVVAQRNTQARARIVAGGETCTELTAIITETGRVETVSA